MDLTLVDPRLRAATARLRVPRLTGPARALVRLGTRLMPPVATPGVTRTVVREGPVRVRVFRPVAGTPLLGPGAPDEGTGRGAAARPALLWVHGGGLVIGTAKQDDRLCGATAAALGIPVVSAEYPLAPEHPFPQALDALAATWRWVRAHAPALGVDPGRVAVGGQSAGGGLAAALVQRLHDEGGTPPAAQWLFSPMLDDRTAADRDLDAVGHLVWDNADNRIGWSAYLGAEPGAPALPPYASPARRDDLSGLPPAWLSAGEIELFRGEVERYAERLRAAGVPAELVVVPGAPHGFETWAWRTVPARGLVVQAHAWLRDALASG